jgi:hypothetical protein
LTLLALLALLALPAALLVGLLLLLARVLLLTVVLLLLRIAGLVVRHLFSDLLISGALGGAPSRGTNRTTAVLFRKRIHPRVIAPRRPRAYRAHLRVRLLGAP